MQSLRVQLDTCVPCETVIHFSLRARRVYPARQRFTPLSARDACTLRARQTFTYLSARDEKETPFSATL